MMLFGGLALLEVSSDLRCPRCLLRKWVQWWPTCLEDRKRLAWPCLQTKLGGSSKTWFSWVFEKEHRHTETYLRESWAAGQSLDELEECGGGKPRAKKMSPSKTR